MAKIKGFTKFFTIFLIILSSSTLSSAKSQHFSRTISSKSLKLKKEKLSHLHFYFHDIVSGKNPTAVRVAQANMTNTSPTLFGVVVMIDDPLTVAPEPSSKLVGRAQGIYASASQNETGLLMVMNFVFMEGKYNGSTLSVLGRNTVFSTVREMPIIAGSGIFRFARGYAQAKTHTFDLRTGDAIVEYNVYAFHY
ncbi:Dirigent protein [Melia azedarach]|uniref:Dirigent protein n=1 Tax=Melia azedarach TaxID=155640 RepID=A0ACC1X2I8_MELAZ|nr:Dirigent protein [Melia azedarach]